MVEHTSAGQSRRRFLKRSTTAISGILGEAIVLSHMSDIASASSSDPHWTISDRNQSTVPLGPPTPEGTHDRTMSFGSGLNYIATYWGEETFRNIHAFTYGAKGLCTHSYPGETTEYSYADLTGQTVQVSSYKQKDNLDYVDDPFKDAPGFGVRPSSGGDSLNYGEAAYVAIDTAVAEVLGYYNPAFSIGYGAAKAIEALQDTSGSSESDAKSLDYGSDHEASSENETYARFLARHDGRQEAGMKVQGSTGGVSTTYYIRFPATTQTSSTYTSQDINTSGEVLRPETHMSESASELRAKGYQLLADNSDIVYEGVVPDRVVQKRPALKAAAGGGRLHKIKYPLWGKSISEPSEYDRRQRQISQPSK